MHRSLLLLLAPPVASPHTASRRRTTSSLHNATHLRRRLTKTTKNVLFLGRRGLELSLVAPSTPTMSRSSFFNKRTETIAVRNDRDFKEAIRGGFVGPEYFLRVEGETAELESVREEVMRLIREAEEDVERLARRSPSSSSAEPKMKPRKSPSKQPSPETIDLQKGWIHTTRAGFHQAVHEYDDALAAYKSAREAWKTANNDSLNAMALMHEGYVLEKCRQYEAARKAYEEALEIRERCLPSQHPYVAVTLRSIAMLLEKKAGNDCDAVSASFAYHMRAIAIDDAVLKEVMVEDAAAGVSDTEEALNEQAALARQVAISRINYGVLLMNVFQDTTLDRAQRKTLLKRAYEEFNRAAEVMYSAIMRLKQFYLTAKRRGLWMATTALVADEDDDDEEEDDDEGDRESRFLYASQLTEMLHRAIPKRDTPAERANAVVLRSLCHSIAQVEHIIGRQDSALAAYRLALRLYAKAAQQPEFDAVPPRLHNLHEQNAILFELNEEIASIHMEVARVYQKKREMAMAHAHAEVAVKLFEQLYNLPTPRLEAARRIRQEFADAMEDGDEGRKNAKAIGISSSSSSERDGTPHESSRVMSTSSTTSGRVNNKSKKKKT